MGLGRAVELKRLWSLAGGDRDKGKDDVVSKKAGGWC
jgi:hypothetical protein